MIYLLITGVNHFLCEKTDFSLHGWLYSRQQIGVQPSPRKVSKLEVTYVCPSKSKIGDLVSAISQLYLTWSIMKVWSLVISAPGYAFSLSYSCSICRQEVEVDPCYRSVHCGDAWKPASIVWKDEGCCFRRILKSKTTLAGLANCTY